MDDDEINKEKPRVHISIKERQIRISQLLNSNKNDKGPTKTVEFNLLEEQNKSKCVSKFNMEKRQLSLKNTAIAEKLNNALFSKGNSCTDTLISYDRKNTDQSKELNLKNKNGESLKKMDYSLLSKKISENYKNQLSNVLLMKNNNPQALPYKNAPKKKKDTDIFEKGISIEGVLINKKVNDSNEDNETEKKKKKHLLKLFSKNSFHANKQDTTMEKNNNSLNKEMKSYYKNKTFTDRFLNIKHHSYNSEDINSETISKNNTIVEKTTLNKNKKKKNIFFYFKNICKRKKYKINSKQQLHSSQSNSTTSMQSLNENKKHSKFFFFCVK
ncbi:conserved Plasmodium protein, unknown function [Plasmodium sp. DRC-Itaito]|nr:conserved Plasmodium protein, unknown function [Plasmodium sp. DRC-Itaito]